MKKLLVSTSLFLFVIVCVITSLRPDLANSANPSWVRVGGYSGTNRTIDIHSKHLVLNVGRADIYEVTEKWENYSDNYWETYPIQIDCKLHLVRVNPNAPHNTSTGLKSTKLWASEEWTTIVPGSNNETTYTLVCGQ